MNNVLKRGLSVFLVIAIVFSSVLVGLGECDFNGLFTIKSKAAEENESIFSEYGEADSYAEHSHAINNDIVYIEEGSLLCNGEVTYTVKLKGGIGVTGAVFAAKFDPQVLEFVAEKSGASTTVGSDGDEFNNFGGVFTSGMKHGTDNVCVVGNANLNETVRSDDIAYVKFTFKFIDTSVDYTDIDFYCTEFIGSVNVPKNDLDVVIGCSTLGSEIPDSGHIAGDTWVIEKEATVFEPGVKFNTCSLCGKRLGDVEIPQLVCAATTIKSIKQSDNTLVLNWERVEGADTYVVYRITDSAMKIIARVDGNTTTYTDTGLVSNETYSYAIKVENEAGYSEYSNQVSFTYHIHKMSDWLVRVAPTCTEGGISYIECDSCDYEETMTVEPLGHNYSDEWTIDVAPTCTENGSKSHHCENCDDKIDITPVASTGHTMGDWLVRVEPTCTENGVDYKKCADCDYEETRTVNPLGHDYSDEWTIDVAPTCIESGSKSHHCIVCDDKADITAIAPTGHTSSDWINDPSTCTQEGLSRKVCLVCGIEIESKIIPANGHTIVIDKAVEPTCTNDGKTEGSHCSVCNMVEKAQDVIPATGHSSTDWIIDLEATCTTNGSMHKECTVCGETIITETISATGHSLTDWIVDTEATCTADGSKHKECTICDEIVQVQTLTAKGHKLTDWIIDTEATCTKNGAKHKECTVCDVAVEDMVIPATGHTEVIDVAVAATCTTAGKTEGKHCSVCNEVTVAQQTVSAKGHTIVKDNAVAVTCTTDGKTEGSHCSVCGFVIVAQQIIPAKGHNSSDWKYNEKTRNNYKECTVCNAILEQEYIPLKTTNITSCYNEVDGVQLKWDTVQDASSYEVYYKLPTQNVWRLITSTTNPQYLDTDVTGNKVYQYSVKVVDKYGNKSDFSAQRECRFLETPKLLTRESVVGGVKITWTKVEGATSYRIYRRGAGTDYWFYLGDFSADLDTFTDYETANYFPGDKNKNELAKPKSGNYYRYTVRASYDGKDSSGKDYLIYSGFDTEGLFLKYVATPKLISISNATGGLQIKWTAVAGAGKDPVKYNVYRRGAGSTSWSYLGSTTGTTWTDGGVKNANGGYYRYTVRAIDGWYSAFDANGLFLKRLANPTLTGVVSSKSGITVKWGAIKGTTGYYVYRKTASSGWTRVGVVNGTNNTTYLDKTAKKGVTYTYTVRAVSGSTISYFNSGISCKDKY